MATYNDKILVPNSAKDELDTIHPETNTSNVYDFKNDGWLADTFDDVQTELTTHLEDDVLHNPIAVTTGTSAVYNVTLPNVTELHFGLAFTIRPHIANDLSVKINVNGLGEFLLTTSNGGHVPANMLSASGIYNVRYTKNQFYLVGMNSLSDAVNDTSEHLAATANAVKMVNDKIDSPPLDINPSAGWTKYGVNGLQLRKTGQLVTIKGDVILTSTSSSFRICSLPVGYRSNVPIHLLIYGTKSNVAGAVIYGVIAQGDLFLNVALNTVATLKAGERYSFIATYIGY